MSIKIFLLNIHSDRNAGDLALSRVTIQQLQTNFPGSQITLSMNDPQSYNGDLDVLGSYFIWIQEEAHWHLSRLLWLGPATLVPLLTWRIFGKAWYGLTPKRIRDWVRVYIEADLIASTAGGYLYSSGKGLTIILVMYSLALAVLAGKPLYIFPQSIGPFAFKWECTLARWLYTRARIVMAREPISYNNLIACGIPESKCLLLPDLAFGFIGASKEAAQQWLQTQGIDSTTTRPLLGMTIIDWGAWSPGFDRQSAYEEAVIAAIKMFIEQYAGKVLLLPQTWGPTDAEDDRIVAHRVADRIPELGHAILVVEEPLSPDLLQAVFGEMDLVIGTRMHSNIFSVSRGVPVLPIGYLHKSLGIAQVIGLDEWVIDIRQVDAEILTEKLVTLWERRTEVRTHLEQTIPTVIEESQKAGKLIAQDFASLADKD